MDFGEALPTSSKFLGLKFLEAAKRFMLARNMRTASHDGYADYLMRVRCLEWLKPPITHDDLNLLKVLTEDDIVADNDWLFAPIAVMGNPEGDVINTSQMFAFAQHFKLPLVCWKMRIETLDRNLNEVD
jgi:hypothetical protein